MKDDLRRGSPTCSIRLEHERTGQQVAAQSKIAGMSAPSEAIKPVGGGMNMSMKNAKVVGER